MPPRPTLVSLATAWGPKFGGINAFNVELLKSLGIQPRRDFDLYCAVLAADAQAQADASRYKVDLMPLGDQGKDFPADAAERLQAQFAAKAPGESWIWIGHDITSGELALQLRERHPGSRAALIHHMAFGAYQDFKKGDSRPAAEKREQQRRMFQAADLCLAVGPMLREQLQDLLGEGKAVEMLVPGLADPNPELLREKPPNNFTAFVAGRLGDEDDRIKQGALAVRGYGAALAKVFDKSGYEHSPLRKSPSLRMRGVPVEAQAAVRKLIEAASGRVPNCDLAPFGEDREDYFRDLAGSSVAMMPSWHEGFGLVAWEAIACRVPVVIGEQSGVYRLLHGPCQSMGLGRSVHSVAVQGHLPDSDGEPNHSAADVAAVRDALISLGDHINERKADACELAENLRRRFDYTWERCAGDLLAVLERRLGCRLLFATAAPAAATPVVAAPEIQPASPDLPGFLQPPRPRPWRPDGGQAPSALLLARDQIVRFDPERDAVVEHWLDWMADPATPRLSLRLVTGPGGMGKTRSALEAVKRAGQRGWPALWLAAELPSDWETRWRDWLARAGETPIPLVLDYVEGHQETLLRLLKIALETPSAGRPRLLLLARNGAWWRELPHHTACTPEVAALLTGPGNAGVQDLPPWSRDVPGRESTYLAALNGYAAAQGLTPPTDPYRPDLAAPLYDRPLHLHMAALATLAGERPEHAAALLASQLDREWRYWTKSGLAPATGYDDWADALAWLALVQGACRQQATTTFAQLGIAAAELLDGLARAYPAPDESLGPLQPDPLAEALIRERLAARRGVELLRAALPEDPALAERGLQVIARLAARREAESTDTRGRQTLVAGLAHAWPAHGQRLIAAAHSAAPGLGRLLFEAWQELDTAAQEAIAPQLDLPNYSTPLLDMEVAVERARLRKADEPAQRAGVLNNLSVHLSNLGDAVSRAEALGCAREAVA
ncbi:MAG: hypothetical protein Q8O33_05745, partial [Pseudomonadota bacterium]|nr:hypothetical protein [Pseudomonadota bacterium]